MPVSLPSTTQNNQQHQPSTSSFWFTLPVWFLLLIFYRPRYGTLLPNLGLSHHPQPQATASSGRGSKECTTANVIYGGSKKNYLKKKMAVSAISSAASTALCLSESPPRTQLSRNLISALQGPRRTCAYIGWSSQQMLGAASSL